MEQLLSLIANIIQVSQGLSALGPIRKFQRIRDVKKLHDAYFRAFTVFYDSYGPRDDTLVIPYEFFDRPRVQEQIARLRVAQPMDQVVLLEEFAEAFPDYDPELFLTNIRRFRDKFNEAFQQDLPLDAQLTMSHVSMEMEASTLFLSNQIEDLRRQMFAGQAQSWEGDRSAETLAEEKYIARIDQARDLIKEGKAGAALSLLRKLEDELTGVETSTHLRSRLLTNLGASLLYLGDDLQSAPYFEQALKFAPQDPKALANAGLAALIQGDFEKAINLSEQALAIQSDHSSPLSVLPQALAKAGRLDTLDQGVKTVIEQNVESRRALAFAMIEVGNYEEAERLLRLSVGSAEMDPQDLVLLAQAIVIPIQINEQKDPAPPWNIPTVESMRLQEAEDLLTQAIQALEPTDNRNRFHHTLMLRASARALQNKLEQSAQDCQRILGENRMYPIALHHGGLLALQMQNHPEAIRLLKAYLETPPPHDFVSTYLAVAYLGNQQPREALRVLSEAEKQVDDLPLFYRLETLRLTVQVAQIVGDKARIDDATEKLKALPIDNPLVLETLALVGASQGRMDESIDYLNQAHKISTGNLKNRITLQSAELYYGEGEYDKAASLYEGVVPVDKDTPPTRAYIASLLNSGDWKQAYELARNMRDGGNAIPVISEVEARVAEHIGNLELALDLYTQLADLEPNNFNHFFGIAAVSIRMGRSEEAASSLEAVVDRFKDNPGALMGTAKVFANAKRPAAEVLPLAYRAKQLEMGNPEMHLSYVSLFMYAEGDASISLDCADINVNCSVKLESDRETHWCIILDDEPVDRGRWEYLSTDPVAQRLMGHKVGDVIEFKSGPYEQLTFTIAEIQSKYVRAFQETFMNFGSWFPDHPGLHRVEIVDHDVSPIFRISEMRFKSQDDLRELYSSKQLTLEGFAQSTGHSLAEAWGYHSVGEHKIISSAGTRQEQGYHRQVLEASTSVTIDLLALFTLSSLNMLPLLVELFDKVYVAQACLDVLTENLQKLRQFDRDYGVIGRQDERYVFEEIPKEVTERNIEFLEKVLGFVREHCQVMPIDSALEFDVDQFRKFEFVLGPSSIASIFVAKDTGTPLYSDDFVLRTLAKRGFSVNGVWTQPVLNRAQILGKLNKEDYYSLISILALTNYSFVSLNVPILMHILEKNRWVPDTYVSKIFLPLKETAEASAIGIIADLISEVWSQNISDFHKRQILDLCLQVLVTNRSRDIVIYKLRGALRERFSFREHQLLEINHELELWLRVHQRLGI
ncbi:MAG: hypothetical protein BroJett011_07600 [Chloroflexota bacterium]|nr:MAG: hypothetical protein BroJett011_07600 [Chloroflexota bacterium]